MLSFESQHEHDWIMDWVAKNAATVTQKVGVHYNMYVDAFSMTLRDPTGYVWYTRGERVLPRINFKWSPGEPNNQLAPEYCLSLIEGPNANNPVGMCDFPCSLFTLYYLTNAIVCQKTSLKSRGYNNQKYV